jgi:hypothetical protein
MGCSLESFQAFNVCLHFSVVPFFCQKSSVSSVPKTPPSLPRWLSGFCTTFTMHPGSGVRFFEIGRDKAGLKNETPAGQFRKTEHLTPI